MRTRISSHVLDRVLLGPRLVVHLWRRTTQRTAHTAHTASYWAAHTTTILDSVTHQPVIYYTQDVRAVTIVPMGDPILYSERLRGLIKTNPDLRSGLLELYGTANMVWHLHVGPLVPAVRAWFRGHQCMSVGEYQTTRKTLHRPSPTVATVV